jgi:hypothetical protein
VFFISTKGAGQTMNIAGTVGTITISTGTAGGTMTTPPTNSNCTLTYTTPRLPNPATWRITVQTTTALAQKFGLSVVATNATRGTMQAAVNLVNGNAAINFITGIPRNRTGATCKLNYTASATFANGTGTDNHTVKYTLVQP